MSLRRSITVNISGPLMSSPSQKFVRPLCCHYRW